MATLVKFVKDINRNCGSSEVIAVFPQLKYNKALYGNHLMTCYMHIGQHSSCSSAWINNATEQATKEEYASLQQELENIGYTLRIINRN